VALVLAITIYEQATMERIVNLGHSLQWAVVAAATGIRVLIQVLLVDQVVARAPTTQTQQIFRKA
jgi:hypothetical protein